MDIHEELIFEKIELLSRCIAFCVLYCSKLTWWLYVFHIEIPTRANVTCYDPLMIALQLPKVFILYNYIVHHSITWTKVRAWS